MNDIVKYGGAFIFYIAIQLLIFSNIQFSGYINPYVYIMFILILPYSIQSWILLLLAFLAGITVDIFSGTMGVHTFATVMAAFVRPWILSLNVTTDTSEAGLSPSSRTSGLRWFALYALTVIFIHHFALFFVEVFSFSGFFRTLLRIILSTGATLFFVLVFDILRSRR